MTTQRVKRKLSAILSADVQGYSRLMSQDEVGTIRTLTAYREAMTTLIQQYRGRVVDRPGDNILADFGRGDVVELSSNLKKGENNQARGHGGPEALEVPDGFGSYV